MFEKGLKDCYFLAIPDKPNRINHPKLTKISMASVNHLQMAGLLLGCPHMIYTGWWYTYPSEKYESQIGSSS